MENFAFCDTYHNYFYFANLKMQGELAVKEIL
jgi:hypothetical protein